MRRRDLVCAALALLFAACARPPDDPSQVVAAYLDDLARDPVRTLPVLTPRFHASHGLRFEEIADRPFAPPEARVPTASDDPRLELERARLGWLTLLTKRVFALQAPRIERRVRDARVADARARVPVRVIEPGRAPFDVEFLLRRDAQGRWRIDAVERPEIADAQLIGALVTAPDVTLHRRITALREQRAPRAGAGRAATAPPTAGSR